MAAGTPLTRSLYNDIQEIEWLRRERSASAIHSRIIGGRVPQVNYRTALVTAACPGA